jgi:protein-disulfide isomerase
MALKPILSMLAALAFAAACNPSGGGSTKPGTPITGDSFIGDANASVEVVEFGAPTCPACKSWHDQYWKELKANYVDTGKIRFVFRALPSHNPPVDHTIAAIARCSGQENFFAVLDKGFEDQEKIEQASRSGTAKEALTELAAGFGITGDAFGACINDPAHRQRIQEVQAEADRMGVSGTPTFFVNGVMVRDARIEAFSRQIDTALAASSPAPVDAPAPTETAPAETAPAGQPAQ